jgi:hypothetical protein
MKKRVILIVLVLAFTIFCNTSGIASAKKIMAHYMPWYQSQPFRGSWGWHWTMNHFSPPTTYASHYQSLFGLYDSSDPHVLASQALLMKFAGIDGMIADWYGIANFWDYGLIRDSTNSFIPYIKDANLEFSICYEDATVGNMLNNGYFNPATRAMAIAHGQQVMQWLQTNYFTDPAYTKIDNRPVLLCFGPQFFTNSEWTTLFSTLNPKPQFFPLKYSAIVSYPPKIGEFDWPSPVSGTTPSSPTSSTSIISNLNNFYNRVNQYSWEHYLAGAFPRFHDIYAQAGVGSSYTRERALESTADIVQIVTWNDYGEGTIIEPTVEDGYKYLEITQQMRKQYIDANFTYTAADLRLPVRLYTLRKANLGNSAIMAQLASVESYLFANNLSGAKELLDEIDCSVLHILTSSWLSTPAYGNWNPACDLSQLPDNIIDFKDFAVFAQDWLTGTSY